MELIRSFERLGKNDAGIAGGKGASLGEMTQVGIPVPPGFVVLAGAFDRFLDEANLAQELDTIFHTVNHQEIRTVDLAAERIQSLIVQAPMPQDIADEILASFKALGTTYVAVRSSATAEDSQSAAWAGQLDTFLNTTQETLLQNVQKCWASLFTPRAIFYRFEKGMHGSKISVAVVVQKMVQSEVSGIAFSVHPVTEDYNQLIIEAGFGLGEAIVSGQVTPDSFVVEKEPRRLIDKSITFQSKALWRAASGGNEWRELSHEEGTKPALSDEQALHLAEIVLRIEKHYGFPCDIEWAFEAGQYYITQSRPITTLSPKEDGKRESFADFESASPFSRIIGVDWQQDWNGLYTFTEAWLDNQRGMGTYFASFEQVFGKAFTKMLITYDGDTATGWVSTKEYEDLGTYLATRVQNAAIRKTWLQEYRNKADSLSELISLKPRAFLKRFGEFRLLYPTYGPYVIGTKTAFNFLPPGFEDIARELEEARKYTEQIYKISTRLFSELAAIISKETGYDIPLVRTLNVDELEAFAATNLLPEKSVLQKRTRVGGVYAEKDLMQLLSVEEVNEMKESWRKDFNESELRGQIGYVGVARGRCRIIKDYRNATIADGEILVTSMTDPNFLPLMHKCAAIVTDGGGMLSHAAIVARELKKPCVIGTKFATQILKDGDMVEVDADAGVVRVLNNRVQSETEWVYWGRWMNGTLFASPWHAALHTEVVKRMQPDMRGDLKILDGRYYFPQSDLDAVKNSVATQGDAWFREFFDICDRKTRSFSQFDGTISEFVPALVDILGCSILVEFADRTLEAMVRKACDQQGVAFDDVFALMHPSRKTLLMQYQEELHELASEDIDEFVRKWEWVGTHAFAGKPLTREAVVESLKSTSTSFEKEDATIPTSYDKEIRRLVNIGRDLVYQRSNLIENVDRIIFSQRDALERLADEKGITYTELTYLTHDELVALALGGNVPTNLRARIPAYGYVGIGSVARLILGDELQKELDAHMQRVDLSQELRGTIAYRGIVRGIAKVIHTQDEIDKVGEGDILVARETLPDYIMAMKKAAAFVTDQGGITSHAALLAREMKKPCVIGTKFATQILKDGDMVEVDAEKGIIRKI